MVEVRRKDGESVESMLRRFTRKVHTSGVLIRAKRGRFYQPPKSKREVREGAKRRKLIQDTKDYLKKVGKLEEVLEQKKGRRSRGVVKRLLKARQQVR